METMSRLVVAFLLNSLWQVTLLAGIAGSCALLMRNAPARYRHLLWVMALGVAVLLPLSGLRPFKPQVQDSAPSQPPSSAAPNPAVTSPGFIQMDEPADSPYARWLRKHIGGLNRRISLAPFWLYTLAGCYSLFSLHRLAKLWRAWRETNDIRRTAYAREIPEWMALIAARCQAALGLGNSLGQAHMATSPGVTILCSSQVAGPLTCGARRPAIILPERLFEGPPSEDFTSALCHEMAHIRRQDFLLNLVYELIYLPISFHPAAALLKRRIDETRELACDETAAGCLVDPAVYARSLVSIARSISSLPSPQALSGPGYTLGVFDANVLEERIMRLLDKRPRASARLAKISLALGSLLLAGSCIAASAFSLSVQETESATADVAERFLGAWEGKCQGKTFVIVRLKRDGQKVTGKIGIARMRGDENGQCVEVMDEPTTAKFAQPIADVRVKGGQLSFKGTKHENGDIAEFEMKLTGDKVAELTYLNAAPGVRPTWKITRESDPSASKLAPASRYFVRIARETKGAGLDGGFSAQLRGNLSGRWVLDKAKSHLPKASPDDLTQTIEHGEGRLKITTTSKDWSVQKPISLTLFALTIPEFVTTIDDLETTQSYGPGALKSKTRWEDSNLVTDWRLEKDGQVVIEGKWVRHLSENGKTQVVDVNAEDPQRGSEGQASLVFVRSSPSGNSATDEPPPRSSETGSISGTVFDPSGARVPNAIVSIANEDTEFKQTIAADDAGEFSFLSLPPGRYQLGVTSPSPGFAPYRRQHYVLGPGVTQRLRVVLEPASVMESVVVTAKAAPGAPANPPSSAPQRIRVGGLVQTTKQLEAPKPEYPERARAQGVQGIVLLQAVISKEGAPLSLEVLSSPDPELSSAAMQAVRRWRYEPTRLNGEPIEVVTTIAVRFHLER